MNFPAELKYTKDHEWIKIEGDTAIVGITEFAQRELGDIVYVDIPSVGKEVAKEETFGTVEAVKTVSDLFMPLSGSVTDINPILDGSPELVNTDPDSGGWLFRIKLADPAELADLLDEAAYAAYVAEL